MQQVGFFLCVFAILTDCDILKGALTAQDVPL